MINLKELYGNTKFMLFIAIMFVVLIIALTFNITYSIINASENRLSTPVNFSMNQNRTLVWKEVDNATSYTIQVINRTKGEEFKVYVYESTYSTNEFGIIQFDILPYLSSNNNYSLGIKANSQLINSSNYSMFYELVNVDPVNDVNPIL